MNPTTTTAVGTAAEPRGILPRTGWALVDALAAARRLLLKLSHDPQSITLSLAGPILMVLVFGFIFGSAISSPGGGSYREFLLPGLLVTIAGNVLPSMVQMARDSSRGVVDRFRSMPIARTAVPFGHALATAVYGLVSLVLMAGCGLAIGWRLHRGPLPALAALGLLLLFQLAMTWLGMYLGLLVGKEETAGQLSVLLLPVSMLSTIFVPASGMPTVLRIVADWNPMSAVAAAVRGLFGNPNASSDGAWPLEHPVAGSLLWTAVLLLVFVPLCTRRYARPTS
jgi:ABC-2 type transport system permease protein